MKLEVGAGKSPTPGYTHQDIVAGEHIEIVRPAWDTGLEDASVEEVYSRHFLEHLTREEADLTMKEWMRILTPGAPLRIIVPDLLYHALQLSMPGNSIFVDETNFMHAMYSIYGWPGEHMGHKWGYTRHALRELLYNHGVRDIGDRFARTCDIDYTVRKP